MNSCLLSSLSAQFETAKLEPLPRTNVGPLHPHAVILHRDEYHKNQLDYVAKALTNVVGVLSHEEARSITMRAFTVGRAVVISCPKETAEHYQERLTAYGLTVTVEVQ